jgi:hypothetical protein
MRERKEIIHFSRNDIENIAKSMAKLRIVGDLFIGRFIEQEVQWHNDESLSIIITYIEGTIDDIPSRDTPVAIEHKSKKHKGEVK